MQISRVYRLAGVGVAALGCLAWSLSPSQAQQGAMMLPNPLTGPFGQTNLDSVPTVHLATTIRTPQEARTWIKLHATTLVFTKDTSLGDLIKAIRSATRGKSVDDPPIPIYLDPLGLQMADKTMDSPIEWDVEGIPLAASLPLILKQVGMQFHVMPNGLLMISAETSADAPADPSALILDNLSMLRDEIATLRAEVFALRCGDPTTFKPQIEGAMASAAPKSRKTKDKAAPSESPNPKP